MRESKPSHDAILVRFVNEAQDDFYWYSKNDKNLHPFNQETCQKHETQKEVLKDTDLKWSINYVRSQLGMDSLSSSSAKRKRESEDKKTNSSDNYPKKRIKQTKEIESDNEESMEEFVDEEDEEKPTNHSTPSETKPKESSKEISKKVVKTQILSSQTQNVTLPTLKPQEKELISDSNLKKLYDRLEEAIQNQNDIQIIHTLKHIDEKCIIEVNQLRKIKIAKTINSLQKSSNPQIKRLAAVITARFKTMVARHQKNNDAEDSPTTNTPTKKPEKVQTSQSTSQEEIENEENEKSANNQDNTEKKLTQEERKRIEKDVKELVSLKGLDNLRAYFISEIATALSTSTSNVEEIVSLSSKIEEQVYNVYMKLDQNKIRYRSQLLSIHSNLDDMKNPEFNNNIINGKITPESLATMKSYDMASKDIKQRRAEIVKEEIRMSTVAKGESKGGGMFICTKCKSDKVHTYEVQTRSADEPMTVFATCMNCGRK